MTDTNQRRHRRATIEDVATAAGVSVATVSRALRGLPNVALSTRERVASVAESLHYEPDPAASRLAAGRTRTITVGIPAVSGWYFSTVVAGAEAVATEEGYEFQVIGVGSEAARRRLLDAHHQLERRTDGLLLVDVPVDDEQAASLSERGIALATVGTSVAGHPAVRIDDERVGRIAAAHLAGLGHRRIGLIGGHPDDPMHFEVPRSRKRGFVGELERRGVPLDPELSVGANFGIDDGREAMERLLDLDEPPTAVFAMSDDMAFGALMAIRDRGLVVGRDVSIMGVDDHEFARVVDLTTIHQPVADHGAVGARLVVDELARSATADRHAASGPTPPSTNPPSTVIEAEIELVVRRTTGPPPS